MNDNKDDKNEIKKKKTKSGRNPTKYKPKKESTKSVDDSSSNSRKVKFNDDVHVINVECWKKYNLEQTADENFEALFNEEKDDKDTNNKNKKNKDKQNISCTCNII